MKNITFNQLQLRILALLFCLFTSAVFGYRYFVELPKLEQSIAKLSEKELDILNSSITNTLNSLAQTNYDYAVWTSSYEFIRTADEEYIEENYVANTFTSLKIDGVFYLDENFVPIYVQGFHSTKLIELTFSFYDFTKNPNNLKMFPDPTTKTGVPKKEGFINTINGPAMYSTVQIRDSDMNGQNRGFLIMIRLLEQPFLTHLSKQTLTDISDIAVTENTKLLNIQDWKTKVESITVQPFTDIALCDDSDELVSIIRLKHSNAEVPELINEQSIIFIVLMSLFIYIVYFLVSNFIIMPVKKLAIDIKHRDNNEKFDPLDEQYTVRELAIVSKNVNQLMATIKQQNDLLAKQVVTDSLTGITNKRGLMEAIELHSNLCIREGVGYNVVMVDIDYFKKYNDAMGHLEGDTALYKVANAINQQCKCSGDICARYGGEEFTLLLAEMTDEQLNKKLTRIMFAMQELALEHPCSPISNTVTISMGAVVVKASDVVDLSLSVNDILRVADQGLYEAKDAGRNRFVINHLSENKTAD
jgi:diguanylate cyclase (GGDEF)-like protein